MEPASPARLYATLVGAALFVGGIVGFFYDLSWINYVHVATGALGLLLAGAAPRPYALCMGLVYLGLAIWGFSGSEQWLQWPHLALGVLGLAAVASPGNLKARAKTTAEGT
jgi:hypothetical protein